MGTDKITPQLAKLMVLEISLAQMKKAKGSVEDEALALSITIDERATLRQAFASQILNLESNIAFQKKLIGGTGK